MVCTRLKQLLKDQSEDEENRQPSPMLATNNEMKQLNLSESGMISFEKHKLEVEQRVRLIDELQRGSLRFRNTSKNC